MKRKTYYRAIFISDSHLGFRGAQAKALASFLKSIECDMLYLVGDIVDLWAMKKKIWWNDDCNEVIRRILKLAQKGTKIVYIPGNHDESIRSFLPLEFGGIQFTNQIIHTTSNGDNYVILHGDCYDVVVGHMKWLAVLGSTIYDLLMVANHWLHAVRVRLGYHTYWSLAGYLKTKAKKAISFMNDFETALVKHAKHENCVGVICGHIHKAKIEMISGIRYVNCGDWVESLTAIVENSNGILELIDWHSITIHNDLVPAESMGLCDVQ